MPQTVGVRDVAQRARVSVGTVSNALNRPHLVSPSTLHTIQQVILELGFVRNDAARQLRAGHSTTIGMLILDGRNPFFMDVARSAGDQAALGGFSVTLGNSDENDQREREYLELFDSQRVRGVLAFPYGDISAGLAGLSTRGIPTVLLGRSAGSPEVSSVLSDDVAGGALAARHLLEIGRRRLAFVGGPVTIPQVADRLSGARSAVTGPDASLETIATPHLSVEAGLAAGNALCARPAGARPDGIVAANDLVAIGLLQAFLAAPDGPTVPGDIALVGYDDIDFARWAVVPLSSVRQPREELGRTAVRILLGEVDDPDTAPTHVVFQPELVIRESSGR